MSIGRISRETFLIITLKFQNHLRVIPKADSERTSHSPSFFFFFLSVFLIQFFLGPHILLLPHPVYLMTDMIELPSFFVA